jgi:hypothetical protein
VNWTDDARQRAEHAHYEESERARGAREIDNPPDRYAKHHGLPDFHYIPANQRAPLVAAPKPAPELPEERDANTASRMSVAQLRDRISGMEATALQKDHQATEDASRKRRKLPILHRPDKPSETRARLAKLKAYRAELATREARDASDARYTAAEERARQVLAAPLPPSNAPQPARVEPADVPALVKCTRCGAMVAQDEDGDMISHLAIGQTVCPAKPTEWTRPRYAAETRLNQEIRAAIETRAADMADGHAERAELLKRAGEAKARAELRDLAATVAAKAAAEADAPPAAIEAAKRAQVRELPPVPTAEAKATEAASSRRRTTVAAIRDTTSQAELTDLDKAVEALVRQHSSGAVIDAAWSAAHRIFAGGRA